MRIAGLVFVFLSTACGAPRQAGTTMPSPEGCFVRVWDQPDFAGASDYINGPRRYANLREMPGDRLWRDRIESATVGPTAVVTVWTEENFQRATMRLSSNTEYRRLPSALTRRIESLAVECARDDRGLAPHVVIGAVSADGP